MKARKQLILAGTLIVFLFVATLGSVLIYTNDNVDDRNVNYGLQDIDNNDNNDEVKEVSRSMKKNSNTMMYLPRSRSRKRYPSWRTLRRNR